MNARRLALGSLVLGTLVVGALVVREKPPTVAPPAPAPPDPMSMTAPAAREAPVTRTPGCNFAPGAELAYSIDATVEVALPGAASQGPSQMSRTAHSVLALKALEQATSGAVLLARFREVDATLTADSGDLTPPFLLRVDERCQLVAYARLDTTGIREGRAQQAMTYNLVWSWPSTKEGASREGLNDFGRFRATYNDLGTPRPRIERRIDAFTQVWSDDWEQSPLLALGANDEDTRKTTRQNEKTTEARVRKERKPLSSSMTVDAGEGPWFASLDGRERVHVAGSDLESRIRANLVPVPAGTFEGAPVELSRYVWGDLLHRRVPSKLATTPDEADRKEMAEVKGLPLDRGLARYAAHVDAQENISQTWPHLRNYLTANPEAATALGKKIREGGLPAEGSAGVFVAMGKTPTTEARAALLEIKNDTNAQVMDRSRAAFSLVDRDDVGIELARELRRDASTIASGPTRENRLFARHAALALGMMGSLKGAEQPTIASEVRGAIGDILSRGTTATTLRPAFGTMANLGDPSMLGVLTPFTHHADPQIRRAATIAIRRMPTGATRALTVAWLRDEKDPEVKGDLYHVVRLQHHDEKTVADRAIVAQAIRDLDQKPGLLTRQAIVNILGEAKDDYPEAKGALLASVQREIAAKDEGIFPQIQQYLTGDEIAPFLPVPTAEGAHR